MVVGTTVVVTVGTSVTKVDVERTVEVDSEVQRQNPTLPVAVCVHPGGGLPAVLKRVSRRSFGGLRGRTLRWP